MPRQRALGLYAIIAFKLTKGALLLVLAFGVYSLVGDDLREQLERLLRLVRIDPERQFFEELADRLALVTPAMVGWIAMGTLLYSLFSLVEAIGLASRASWAGWLAIGESAFFIPIEVHHLMRGFTGVGLAILLVNVFIVLYLYRNRARLLHHHHHGPNLAAPALPPSADAAPASEPAGKASPQCDPARAWTPPRS